MTIYLYESIKDTQIKAFTVDESGANLPSEHGPWQRSGSGSVIATGNGTDPVSVLVKRSGYFIAAARSTH
jgi:hypothetical protein